MDGKLSSIQPAIYCITLVKGAMVYLYHYIIGELIMNENVRKTLLIVFVFLLLVLTSSNVAFADKTDKQPPTAPANLQIVSKNETSVTLKWDEATDNVGVNAYSIYKDGKYFASTLECNYRVENLTPGIEYEFYIKAKDIKRNLSKPSNVLTVTLSMDVPDTPESAAKKIVGYYAAWSSYAGFTPDKLDANKLTHINYAFANIGSDFKIAMGYPDKDPANFKMLQDLKKINPDLKILISVGGWTWSGRFSDAAATETSRTDFAEGCVEFITKYGLDGVDLDWEYPVGGGLAENSKRPEDKQNFTLLLNEIRKKMDEQGLKDNKHYLLTIAGGAGNYYIKNTEPGIFHEYIDYATLMTYDIHGPWDSCTDFNAPLYNNQDSSPQTKWSVDSSVNAWIAAGFPKEKLVAGVPFYGYLYETTGTGNNGLYQTFSSGKSLSYAAIEENYLNKDGFTRYFHEQSMVPWLYNKKEFISYDDAQSMSLKANYINTNGLGGAAVWELSQDSNKVLLNSLYENLK